MWSCSVLLEKHFSYSLPCFEGWNKVILKVYQVVFSIHCAVQEGWSNNSSKLNSAPYCAFLCIQRSLHDCGSLVAISYGIKFHPNGNGIYQIMLCYVELYSIFISYPSSKIQSWFFVTFVKLVHHSNLVQKCAAGVCSLVAELNVVISIIPVHLFLLICSGCSALPLS